MNGAVEGWLKVQQVADFAGVSGSQVRGRWCPEWAKEGRARKVTRPGGTRDEWRIHPDVLNELTPAEVLPAARPDDDDLDDEDEIDDEDEDDEEEDDDNDEDPGHDDDLPNAGMSVLTADDGRVKLAVGVDRIANRVNFAYRVPGRSGSKQSCTLELSAQLAQWLGENLLRHVHDLEQGGYPQVAAREPLRVEVAVTEHLRNLVATGVLTPLKRPDFRILISLLAAQGEGAVDLDRPMEVTLRPADLQRRARVGRGSFYTAVQRLTEAGLLTCHKGRRRTVAYRLRVPTAPKAPSEG